MGVHSFNNTLGAKLLHAAAVDYKFRIAQFKYNNFYFTEKLPVLNGLFLYPPLNYLSWRYDVKALFFQLSNK